MDNREAPGVNRDGRDDGLVFYPLTYKPGAADAIVNVSIGVANVNDTRYARDADRSLYANVWIDWNTDGDWEDAGEHVVNRVQINPRGTPPPLGTGLNWEIVSQGSAPTISTERIPAANDLRSATFRCTFPVPRRCACLRPARDAGHCGLARGWTSVKTPAATTRARFSDRCRRCATSPSRRATRNPRVRGSVSPPAPHARRGRGLPLSRRFRGRARLSLPHTRDAGRGPTPVHLSRVARSPGNSRSWSGRRGRNRCAAEPDAARLGRRRRRCDVHDCSREGWVGNRASLGHCVCQDSRHRNGRRVRHPRVVGVPDDAFDDLPRYQWSLNERRLHLSGWADWNGDGDWEDTGERIIGTNVNP